MLSKIEDFLMNRFAGKLISRGVVLLVSFIVTQAARQHVTLDPVELTTLLSGLALSAFEWFKAKRAANPASVTVQTDMSKTVPNVPLPS